MATTNKQRMGRQIDSFKRGRATINSQLAAMPPLDLMHYPTMRRKFQLVKGIVGIAMTQLIRVKHSAYSLACANRFHSQKLKTLCAKRRGSGGEEGGEGEGAGAGFGADDDDEDEGEMALQAEKKEEYHKLLEEINKTLEELFATMKHELLTLTGGESGRESWEGLSADNMIRLEYKLDEYTTYATTMLSKIMSFYDNITTMDKVQDVRIVTMYVYKALRFFFMWLSLMAASTIFQRSYIDLVYMQNKGPPNLCNFVMVFLLIDLMFSSMIIGTFFLIKKLMEGHSFMIDNQVMMWILADYLCTTLIIMVVCLLIAFVEMKKAYFAYRDQGLRAIRALEEISLAVAGIMNAVPFFLIFA
jgi:hypothetical protein